MKIKAWRRCYICFLILSLSLSSKEGIRPIISFADEHWRANFSVLSYNTHGLPGWVTGDKAQVKFPAIGHLLNFYDVVLLQEDFVYHNLLLRQVTHPVVERAKGKRRKISHLLSFLCGSCDSGLTVLSRFPRTQLLEIHREPYHRCAGWLGGGNDCWVQKGFMHTRWQLAGGVKIDIYNTHLDSDESPKDHQARVSQLNQLRDYILKQSGDVPLIVAGDLNLDQDTPGDQQLLGSFVNDLKLIDTQAQKERGKWPFRLDYILYRSGANVQLSVLEAGIAEEFAIAGKPLSDHPALYTRFRIAKN